MESGRDARAPAVCCGAFSFDTPMVSRWHTANNITMTMKTLLAFLTALLTLNLLAADTAQPCYEMRVYYAAPGKLDDLNARFRNHTLKLFEKHGIMNVGYWMPLENPDRKLIYLLSFPSRAAAKASWKAFGSDPEWREVVKKTEANGRLVTKVESTYLAATDYSPTVKPTVAAESPLFELRTYKTPAGKLEALNARFRNHTTKLFAKHGMGQFGYWMPLDQDKGASDTLIYLLAHKNKEAADASFTAFRADPDWTTAKAASEKDGPLTLPAPDGVKSVYLKATDYSPTR